MPLISRKEAAAHLGLTAQAVSLLAKRVDCPKDGDKFRWPEFNVWYWTTVKAPKPANWEEAKARREAALAEQEELKLEQMRGRIDTVANLERRFEDAIGRVYAKLKALPTRLAAVSVGIAAPPEGVTRFTPVVDEVIAELGRGEDVPDDDTEEETA